MLALPNALMIYDNSIDHMTIIPGDAFKFLPYQLLMVGYKPTITVLNVHEVHTSAGCPKQGLRVLTAMPTVGEIDSADLCGCRFVKGKSAAQIVDEHGLGDGMSKPGRKTRQGHRLTRTRAVEEFGNEDIGSLHTDANSAAQEVAACTQMRIRQRAAACASQGLDLARSKTWTKDCPRHTSDSIADEAKAGR